MMKCVGVKAQKYMYKTGHHTSSEWGDDVNIDNFCVCVCVLVSGWLPRHPSVVLLRLVTSRPSRVT